MITTLINEFDFYDTRVLYTSTSKVGHLNQDGYLYFVLILLEEKESKLNRLKIIFL